MIIIEFALVWGVGSGYALKQSRPHRLAAVGDGRLRWGQIDTARKAKRDDGWR